MTKETTNEKLGILVGDATAAGVKVAEALRDAGYYAFTRKKDGKHICSSIIRDTPDVALVDLSMPGMDAVALMNEVNSLGSVRKTPAFIVVSDIKNDFIERQVTGSGASFCLSRPVDIKTICTAVQSVGVVRNVYESGNIEYAVTDTIQRLGIPAHYKGYSYLRTAIINNLTSEAPGFSMTKSVYPVVAHKYNTTPSCVERAMRHAITIAWERYGSIKFPQVLGFGSCSGSRPTNSEFVALVSDRIRLRIKIGGELCRQEAI